MLTTGKALDFCNEAWDISREERLSRSRK